MGCDIHVHTEVKIYGVWHHYAAPRVDRWYDFFGHLGDVRNNHCVQPIAADRGMPKNASALTEMDYEGWGVYAHSVSWCTRDEWSIAYERAKSNKAGLQCRFDFVEDIFPPECTLECRVVFWFDN